MSLPQFQERHQDLYNPTGGKRDTSGHYSLWGKAAHLQEGGGVRTECLECGGELVYKFAFGGDEEGRGVTTIYQCRKCKELAVR